MSKNTSTLKKAYCPHCKTDNELDPIFDVNPEADVCYCPICLREYKPKDVIDNYNLFISNKINKADTLLFRDTKFMLAYESYGKVLKIDSNSYRARFGRILSLIYLSTLRKSNFANAQLLLESEAEQYFRKLKDQLSYTKFLNKINVALDEYYKRFRRKITIRDRFYNVDCIELYFLRIDEIIKLKAAVIDELEKSYQKTSEERTQGIIDSINDSIADLLEDNDERVIDCEGNRYKLARIINKQVYITKLEEKVNPLTGYIRRKLNEEEKKGRLISDKVYPDNSHITSLIKGALPLMITFTILAVAAVIGLFIAKDERNDLFLLISAISCGAVAISSTIFYIIWKVQLSKRRHLID